MLVMVRVIMIRDWLLTLDADYMRSASPTCTLLSRRASFARLPPPLDVRIASSRVCPGCAPGVPRVWPRHTRLPTAAPHHRCRFGSSRFGQHANTPNGQTAKRRPFAKAHEGYDCRTTSTTDWLPATTSWFPIGLRVSCRAVPPCQLPNGECPARLLSR